MVGSDDYRARPLNAAICRRSAGSTLKPFLYALAVEVGAAELDRPVADVEMRFPGWRPANGQKNGLSDA